MSLSVVLMRTLVGRVGASRRSITVRFVSIVAIALGVTLRDESISPAAVAGTVVLLVGARVASRKET
jgi:drug/metabolite transporter (DMT)-like permease